MRFIVSADTDIGNVKNTNEDSVLVKHGRFAGNEILMAVVCDGMGGLTQGELASATVIRAFSSWFDQQLETELEHMDMRVIGEKWSLLLKELNVRIGEYGRSQGSSLGTTFSGLLIAGGQYLIVHVGDSRVYRLDTGLTQLTADQTYVAREVRCGRMTPEQAKKDKRRNMLLQCVGASDKVEPEVLCGGAAGRACYLLCSDGLRHELTPEELYEALAPEKMRDRAGMEGALRTLIDRVKQRGERDNISAVLIKAE